VLNGALYHEDVCRSGGIAPPYLSCLKINKLKQLTDYNRRNTFARSERVRDVSECPAAATLAVGQVTSA
jgi:hypothetical protein